MVKYDNEHWKTLIETIIKRIGARQFLVLAGNALMDDYTQIAEEMIEWAGFGQHNEETVISGREKGELSFMQQEAMKLKR